VSYPGQRQTIELATPSLILTYAIAFAVFDLVPIGLSDVDSFKGLSWGDLVDATLVVLPVALLVRMALDADLWSRTGLRPLLLLALLLLIQGHAIHLAANAIAHSLSESDPAWEPAYFLDEHWGHYEIHVALLSLALMFIVFVRQTTARPGRTALLLIAIAAYGSLQGAGAIEGQTVPLVLPLSIVLALAGAWLTRRESNDYRTFFAASYGLCFIVLVVYGALNGGWPEIL
jgi:hypothetical protein